MGRSRDRESNEVSVCDRCRESHKALAGSPGAPFAPGGPEGPWIP